LQDIHNAGVIHQDIKPSNFMLSFDKKTVILIDFGISKMYTLHDGTHIPYSNSGKMIGSNLYASINSHLLIELSRRDDLFSFCYLCYFLFHNSLPWHNSKNIINCKNEFIKEIDTPIKLQLSNFLKYLNTISYSSKPKYFLIEIFINTILERI
jgi:serine/threonine protein kinase